MKILFVSSELSPYAKVGGLADVAGSLPYKIREKGVDISILIPFYETIKGVETEIVKKDLKVSFQGRDVFFDILKLKGKERTFFIKNDHYFSGDIYLEADASSGGSMEEAAKFFFFSLASIETAKFMNIDIIHCNDWHTSLIPYLRGDIKTLLTIHNIGYQGIYSKEIVNKLLNISLSEDFNCLKEGVKGADFVNTVSKNYAKELLTPQFGFGLEEELIKKGEAFSGILNGIDNDDFNPLKDKNIYFNYDLSSFSKRERNKSSLEKDVFREESNYPLFGIVSRLAEQKGFDLLEEIIDNIFDERLRLIILGKGEKRYEEFFLKKAKENPQKLAVFIGFDEKMARRIYAGSDFFLMPSRFEPCGLGQLIAMRYGSIPVARETGGLKDTISKETGILFKEYSSLSLLESIKSAIDLYHNKELLNDVIRKGMEKDFSWDVSADEYISLYEKIKE